MARGPWTGAEAIGKAGSLKYRIDMPAPVRLADIAAHFGVSTITASRALRRPHLVRAELGTAIRAYAAEHGYRPSSGKVGGRDGASAHTDTAILAVTLSTAPNLHRNPYLAAVQRGVAAAGVALGLTVDQRACAPKQLAAEIASLAADRRWRGLLVNPMLAPLDPRVFAPLGDLPVACIESDGGSGLPCAGPDHDAARAVLRAALQRIGARRPACCLHPGSLAGRRSLGAEALIADWRAAGLDPAPTLIGERDDVAGTRRWLAQVRPDAVICTYADTARIVWDHGSGVPSCVIDRIDPVSQVAGLAQQREAMGWMALRTLLWAPWEAGPAYRVPVRILVAPTWVDGDTWPTSSPAVD